MTHKNPFTPEEIAALRQHRQELLDLMRSSHETIARCTDTLKRVDQMLDRVDQHAVEPPAETENPSSGLVARWLTRKAS